MRLLLTGFGPFPGVPRNPSARLAVSLATEPRLRLLGIEAKALVLPTTYAAIDLALLPALAQHGPGLVLMLGVAARRRALSIETRATNRASRLMPDASGQTGLRLTLEPDGPAARHLALASTPLRRMVQGVPARLSRDAGRYLCNAAYFAALGQAGGRTAIFVHVPLPERPGRPTLAAMHRALLPLIVGALRQVRRSMAARRQASAPAGR
jgi:pyroglutamyl-peptidase